MIRTVAISVSGWRKIMAEYIKGLELCERFFKECAKPILDKYFPDLQYSAGLIGYGSDVLGYDDEISRDHMWGPRFYMFLRKNDINKKDEIFNEFAENLPYTFMDYSVNFTAPDPNDCGVQHPQFVDSGKVNPLIFIQTFDEFLVDEIGTAVWIMFSQWTGLHSRNTDCCLWCRANSLQTS